MGRGRERENNSVECKRGKGGIAHKDQLYLC